MSTINFEIINVKNVRGYLDENGIVYVNLEDICRGLGFTRKANSGNLVVRWSRVKEFLNSMSVPTCGHDELPEYIPENIFYMLAMKANNKTAKEFQYKLATEILPMIRRTGMYAKEEVWDMIESEPRKVAELINKYADQLELNEKLKMKADEYDRFMDSKGAFSMGTTAKMLDYRASNKGFKSIGRNQLFQILRDLDILQSDSLNWNIPYQEYVDSGMFRVVGKNTNGNRSLATVLVLPKGVSFISHILKQNGYEIRQYGIIPEVYDTSNVEKIIY